MVSGRQSTRFEWSRANDLWLTSKLSPAKPEFTAIRKQIQRDYGPIPEDANLDLGSIRPQSVRLLKSKDPAEVFKGIYLLICTGQISTSFVDVRDPWAALPKDDYEVARLRFLWRPNDGLKPLAMRLLQKDPNDAEVLCQLSFLYSHIGNKETWKPKLGLAMAKKALKLAPGPKTYFHYADGLSMFIKDGKNDALKREEAKYLDLYLKTAKKNDSDMQDAHAMRKWLRDRGF